MIWGEAKGLYSYAYNNPSGNGMRESFPLGEECKRGEFVSRTTRPPAQILSGLEVVPMVALTWIEA